MARQKQSSRNRRKKSSASPFLKLLLLLLLMAGLLLVLERSRNSGRSNTAENPVPPVVQPMPAKPDANALPAESKIASDQNQPGNARKKLDSGSGVVALVIDDMGSSLQEAQQLLATGIPMTFSVIPGLPRARQVAELAHARGVEVMIHIPMEPRDYPSRRLEANGLLTAHDNDEIARRVNGYFQGIPHAVGANNHMGSRFTENSEKKDVVLRVLRNRQLFFLDSVTSDRSVAFSLAREMNVRSVRRDFFLDNVHDVAAIRHELDRVAGVARRGASVVAICHPHPETIEALVLSLPLLREKGVRFVLVSSLAS